MSAGPLPVYAPEEIAKLVMRARQCMSMRDYPAAATAWEAVLAQVPADVGAWMGLAAARRAIGDLEGALAATDEALALGPLAFTPLLMRASLLERLGRLREAGPAYGNALRQAPPEETLDPATRAAAAHGRTVNAAYAAELSEYLHASVDLPEKGGSASRKAEAFIDSILGRRKRYVQEPMGYFYPGLPAIEFWDREEFPWLEALEASIDDIRHELAVVMAQAWDATVPYIDYGATIPLDQWADLNRSRRWSAFHLLEYGRRVEANAVHCPRTMAALAKTDQPTAPNRSPAAMFSVLDARTHIPPHTGVSNTRLVCHLPLIVPPKCRFRVGNEVRTYEERKAWVFDDTIEHEAWNDSDETRIILLFDVWNPRLTPWERQTISAISGALDDFNGTTTPDARQSL